MWANKVQFFKIKQQKEHFLGVTNEFTNSKIINKILLKINQM